MAEFDGRRVLLTGAAGGLGTALCRALVRAGAEVVATDLSEEKGAALTEAMPEASGKLRYATLDQSRTGGIEAFVAQQIDRHGPIDSLVNNAAIYPTAEADKMPWTEIRDVLAVNALAATAFVRAVAPQMAHAGFGRIVNVASITFDVGFAGLSAYVASKGALIGLTKVWAREFGPAGITANAISPGAFQTDAEKIHPDPEAYSQHVLNQQAVKRRGVPEDFAHLALFLLDRRSSFITGQTIRVDGGWVMS